MNNQIDMRQYTNPKSKEIDEFTKLMNENVNSLEEVVNNIFKWFDNHIQYSRLKQPYFPLQRNDLEVLALKEGTCGDYSNLIVSVLLNMDLDAKYAYLGKDCYGDEQDHICAAVVVDGKEILIDGTLPYRKWHGYDCKHQEYEIYSPNEFESKFKKTENYYFNQAKEWGNDKYAGINYAPWIYNEVVLTTDERIESVFYFLLYNEVSEWELFINYFEYTNVKGKTPIMLNIKKNSEKKIQFSINASTSIYDENQWSKAYSIEQIPDELKDNRYFRLLKNIDKNIPRIMEIILE